MAPGPDIRLLAILGPPWVDHDVVDAAHAAVAGGVTAIQLRYPTATGSELLRTTENLVTALSVPVYVNNRVDVALAGGAQGVHLGASDLDPRRVRPNVPGGFQIGVSVGNSTEASGVLGARVNYWSIGSVFATSTKRDAGEPIGSSGFRRLVRLAPEGMPVIAIGGISVNNVNEILSAGAIGVAVSEALFGARDIERAARALRSEIDAASQDS